MLKVGIHQTSCPSYGVRCSWCQEFIWLCWVLVVTRGILTASYEVFVVLWVCFTGSRVHGLSSCSIRNPSSPTRGRTGDPCIARQIPWTAREVPSEPLLSVQFSIVKYIHTVVPPISGIFSACKTEILYPLNHNSSCPSPPSPWQQLFYFPFLWIWLHWTPCISEIIQHFFLLWLVYFTYHDEIPRFIHVVAGTRISFLFKA